GYQHNTIASNLRNRQTKTIGVIVQVLNSDFITSVLTGIEEGITKDHYDILIMNSAESGIREVANAKSLLNKRVDGVIASLALTTKNIDHFTPFFARKIPVVFFDRVIQEVPSTKVIIDNFNAGYDATAHLIAEGCTRIAHITADLQRNVYNERFLGYKKALKDNGIIFKDKLVKICKADKSEIIESVELLLKQKPDAFFVTNDFSAAVCMQVLHRKGFKIPEDIAVIGFNNDAICDLITPNLSTVNYPGILMGETAATELINQMKLKHDKENMVDKTIVIPSEIVIRASSLKKGKQLCELLPK
ncbi:LacI family DNA-binding transcriptional regulator, partial [Arachidicoccus sp.]|uniref:LacI family DNA-binding transcriptional regulator n=1 Tax=Arachidicoccus sp. TaxID=1872624 RepID=UPI003D21D0E8